MSEKSTSFPAAAAAAAPRKGLCCPQCRGPVMRVLRQANDKRRWDADAWRRYRCRDPMCNWQGLLAVRRSRLRRTARGGGRLGALWRGLRLLLWLLLAAAVGVAGFLALEGMLQG